MKILSVQKALWAQNVTNQAEKQKNTQQCTPGDLNPRLSHKSAEKLSQKR